MEEGAWVCEWCGTTMQPTDVVCKTCEDARRDVHRLAVEHFGPQAESDSMKAALEEIARRLLKTRIPQGEEMPQWTETVPDSRPHVCTPRCYSPPPTVSDSRIFDTPPPTARTAFTEAPLGTSRYFIVIPDDSSSSCWCGCGSAVNPGSFFLRGHVAKLRIRLTTAMQDPKIPVPDRFTDLFAAWVATNGQLAILDWLKMYRPVQGEMRT